MDIYAYWRSVLTQDAEALKAFFTPDAYINWHNTNEHFTAGEFVLANCRYPGSWEGSVERVETIGSLLITAVHVFSADPPLSFHVTSFIQVREDMICGIDEYWGDDGLPPQWRRELGLGSPILR